MEERPITKEQYERAINERNGYLTEEDESIVFSQSEICGYGVYGDTAHKRINEETGEVDYYVRYWLGSTCD